MTYEFVCETCECHWEEQLPISAPPPKACPKCDSDTVKRLISGAGEFILLGGGWYKSGGY